MCQSSAESSVPGCHKTFSNTGDVTCFSCVHKELLKRIQHTKMTTNMRDKTVTGHFADETFRY